MLPFAISESMILACDGDRDQDPLATFRPTGMSTPRHASGSLPTSTGAPDAMHALAKLAAQRDRLRKQRVE
jgi:hypothetical protein